MRRAISPVLLALVAACAAAPPGAEPDLAPPTPTPPTQLDASVEALAEATRAEPTPDAAASEDASSDAPLAADSAPVALAPEGMNCTTGADCESGLCEGAGCGDGDGVCVNTTRSCGTKLAWYCGCDGKDLQAKADCPGQRFAYKARCTSVSAWGRGVAPDSAPCLKASQCKSGICEGHGCDDAHPGTCQPAMRGCGQSAVRYCGCDGRSFSSNPCPGVRFASNDFCPVDPRATSTIKVLSVTGKSASINAELKAALTASERLRRCHLASGEKTLTVTLQFQVDGEGRLRAEDVPGMGERGSFLPGCITAFARYAVLKAAAGAASRVSVKLRFELGRPKP